MVRVLRVHTQTQHIVLHRHWTAESQVTKNILENIKFSYGLSLLSRFQSSAHKKTNNTN
jgi:hypothetical protein